MARHVKQRLFYTKNLNILSKDIILNYLYALEFSMSGILFADFSFINTTPNVPDKTLSFITILGAKFIKLALITINLRIMMLDCFEKVLL